MRRDRETVEREIESRSKIVPALKSRFNAFIMNVDGQDRYFVREMSTEDRRLKLALDNELLRKRKTLAKRVTLLSGTLLMVDRIYIRKGAEEFDSISFYCKLPYATKTYKTIDSVAWSARFWAKLEDCNDIEFNTVETIRR